MAQVRRCHPNSLAELQVLVGRVQIDSRRRVIVSNFAKTNRVGEQRD
jgi:hypothetical protein